MLNHNIPFHIMSKNLQNVILTVSATSALAFASYPVRAVTTPDADFQARCSAPGVLVCNGFDNASVFTPATGWNDGLHADGNDVMHAFQDTVIKVSGTSSLRFDIPPNMANPGMYQSNMGGAKFGENSTFYVQYAIRKDTVAVNLPFSGKGGNTKQAYFWGLAGGTCQQVELTTESLTPSGYPYMYSACGAKSMFATDMTTYPYWNNNTSANMILHQQGTSSTNGYNCRYGQQASGIGNGVGCFYFQPDTWYTFYYKIQIGTWGQPNSTVQSWISTNGGPYVQWIDVSNVPLDNQYKSQDNNYSKVSLLPYMSNGNPSSQIARFWYDELIVSTQPIAAPGTTSSPVLLESPKNVRVVP